MDRRRVGDRRGPGPAARLPGTPVPEPELQPVPNGTCIALVEAAEQALEQIPPGQGPVTLALVRSYLSDAILETAGREP